MTVQQILEGVKTGTLQIHEAEKLLKKEQFEEMGYAKPDTDRKRRTGFAEVVYCNGKEDTYLLHILESIFRENGEVLGTRASAEQYSFVKQHLPQVQYDPISRLMKIEKEGKEHVGKVAVCTAGTADIPVAEEAAQTAEFFGTNVIRIFDVGVSGIHRLLSRLETIQGADGCP